MRLFYKIFYKIKIIFCFLSNGLRLSLHPPEGLRGSVFTIKACRKITVKLVIQCYNNSGFLLNADSSGCEFYSRAVEKL